MITNTTAKKTYTIAEGVTSYEIGFQYALNPDGSPQIKLYLNNHPELPLEYLTDYKLSDDGLNVVLLGSSYNVGDKLRILRDIPNVQLSNYHIGRIDPEQIEHDFDETVMRDQQLQAEIDLFSEMPIDHEQRIVAIEDVIPEEATSDNQLVDTTAMNTAINTSAAGKVDKNEAIVGATHTKITYDSKGLVTAGVDIVTADVTDLTATATEINVLDGITVSTAELNILDGITASTAELNTLDGITSSTAELNILDGVTADATELNILDGATVTTTELNYVHGVTSGIQTQLDGKVDKNATITSATKCKITYDSKGLVTAGDDITTSDITNINITTPSDGQVLAYDADSQKWENRTSQMSVAFDGITGNPLDNAAIVNLLSTIYPVGSVYIGTQSTCPMATVITGSTWELVSSGKALWTGNGSNGNTTITAGLPNITGTFGVGPYAETPSISLRSTYTSGAFGSAGMDISAPNNVQGAGGYGTYPRGTGFDASRSSSIYGNSSTVQPPAYRVNVWRRTA